jgi:VIT1/CCC1 family predicted Fe2+/Mn2+ transporter
MTRQAGPEIGTDEQPHHWHEDANPSEGGRLNWLRAAVLGANDGIVSTAGVVMGVAGATTDHTAILIAGIAALTAGALSMATGEYVSVSAQRDSEKAMLALEAEELAKMPETEQRELARMWREKGLSRETADLVAAELTAHDALRAHAEIEFGIDPDELVNPWHAAWASMVAFTVGGLIPVLVVAFVPEVARVLTTVAVVVLALGLAGWVSARLGVSPRLPAIVRNVAGGLLAMAITYLIGTLVGTRL